MSSTNQPNDATGTSVESSSASTDVVNNLSAAAPLPAAPSTESQSAYPPTHAVNMNAMNGSSNHPAAVESTNNQHQQPPMPPLSHAPMYHHPYPLPPPSNGYPTGPYSAVVGNLAAPGGGVGVGVVPQYHPHHSHAPPPSSRPSQQGPPIGGSGQGHQGQGPTPATAMPSISMASPRHTMNYEREDSQQQQQHNYHRPVPVRAHNHPHPHPSESEYRGHPHAPPPPGSGTYTAPPPHYGPPPPDDRRWNMGPPQEAAVGHPPPPPPHHNGHNGHNHYANYDSQRYGKPPPPPPPHAAQSYPPAPSVGPGHMSYRYPHPVYTPNVAALPAPNGNSRGVIPLAGMDEKSRGLQGHPQQQHQHQPPSLSANNGTNGNAAQDSFHEANNGNNNDSTNNNSNNSDVDGREGATSPSQIELSHRDEVTNMGCTCKKTKCLKLYCQCFAVKIYCGGNCRCLVCFNTTKHEKQRKDAMRSILSRNPTAFDTKFSKSDKRKTKEQQLSHKLGCKCRKSACMKKYCECYAGNVKCSPNCRCIGCKNIPSNFAPGKPGDTAAAMREGGMHQQQRQAYEIPVAHGMVVGSGGGRTGREPWMMKMNAAQNLAFLKHGSPTVEKRVTSIHDTADVVSVPSLVAAASSDTSPGDRTIETTLKPAAEPKKEGQNGYAVNSLLMAAMAMTEFQSQSAEKASSSSNPVKTEEVDVSLENQKPAARKSLRPSPKRKSSERDGPEGTLGDLVEKDSQTQYTAVSGDSASGGHEKVDDSASSPLDPRELKRTRLGSVRKKMHWEKGNEGEQNSSPTSTKENNSTLQETPDQKASTPSTTADKLAVCTPVSARIIDFRRMNVNEKKESAREQS